MTKHTERQKIQFEETDMTGMLELSDWDFQTTVMNMLRALMEKVDNLQEQMSV